MSAPRSTARRSPSRVVERPAGRQRGELAKRVAGGEGRGWAAAALPSGEGSAVDRGLGETGAVGDALEGVGADQLRRKLEQVGAMLRDGVAHAGLLAPLAREEQRQ